MFCSSNKCCHSKGGEEVKANNKCAQRPSSVMFPPVLFSPLIKMKRFQNNSPYDIVSQLGLPSWHMSFKKSSMHSISHSWWLWSGNLHFQKIICSSSNSSERKILGNTAWRLVWVIPPPPHTHSLALRKPKKEDSKVWDQHGLQSEFQAHRSYRSGPAEDKN